MTSTWNDIKYKWLRSGSKLGILIAVNIACFVVFNVSDFLGLHAPLAFANEQLALPASLGTLLVKPWTIITYMFIHGGVFHLLFNMLWLFWFGEIFESYLGYKRTLLLYFLGGLAGAAFFLAGYNLLPSYSSPGILTATTVIGASASVMAIIVATATLLPDNRISLILIGPVPLKWLAIFLVVLDLVGVAGPNAGGAMAHLGGALIGFIYIKQLQRGHDWNKAVNNVFSAKPKMKVIAGGAAERWRANPSKPSQEEIDRILDKMLAGESLSKHDKETLAQAKEDDQQK